MKEVKSGLAADVAIRIVSLAKMKPGQSGKIVEIKGGGDLAGKLEALGVRAGRHIEKISGQLMRGPVLFRHGHTQAAIGFGMAGKILVEVKAD